MSTSDATSGSLLSPLIGFSAGIYAITVVRTSWTDMNPGRRFHGCEDLVHCRAFLGWIDPPMCERAVQIIPGLLRSKNRVDLENEELRRQLMMKNLVIAMVLMMLGFMLVF